MVHNFCSKLVQKDFILLANYSPFRGATGILKHLGVKTRRKQNENWDVKRIKKQNKKNIIKVRPKPPHPFATHTKSLTIQLFDHFLTITHDSNNKLS